MIELKRESKVAYRKGARVFQKAELHKVQFVWLANLDNLEIQKYH